jgi:hypothetical protein
MGDRTLEANRVTGTRNSEARPLSWMCYHQKPKTRVVCLRRPHKTTGAEKPASGEDSPTNCLSRRETIVWS